MEKIAKNLQLILMCIILISTVIAVGIEIKNMFLNQSVTLADLLLMFLYLEVLAMVRVFWDQQSISITLPLLIAITALARFIILQGKEMDPAGLVYEAVAIVLIASAIVLTIGLLTGIASLYLATGYFFAFNHKIILVVMVFAIVLCMLFMHFYTKS